MRRLGLLLVGSLALGAAPAWAQDDTDTANVAVNGNVAPLCILGPPSPATVDLGQMVATSGSRIGRIATLPNQLVSLPGSFCNFAGSAIDVSVTALVADDNTTLQPGFARAVNYTASVENWAATAAVATSAATTDGSDPTENSIGATQPLPKIADLSVTLSGFTVPSDLLLIAGNYQGAVVVTLGPAASGEGDK
ncbi:MAG: hypothetical protein ACREB7_14400 [Sphingopyxis sp.]|uniref:hypothetical protein n=1 Tax=Sphingopyxis sp. TaxID=1908224 RepID=UPI003D6CC0B9